jgi:hypothetical protein
MIFERSVEEAKRRAKAWKIQPSSSSLLLRRRWRFFFAFLECPPATSAEKPVISHENAPKMGAKVGKEEEKVTLALFATVATASATLHENALRVDLAVERGASAEEVDLVVVARVLVLEAIASIADSQATGAGSVLREVVVEGMVVAKEVAVATATNVDNQAIFPGIVQCRRSVATLPLQKYTIKLSTRVRMLLC